LLLPDGWLVDHFAKVNDRIRSGEVWRLITPMFLHSGLFHAILNATALLVAGRLVENLFGWRALLLVYFSAGLVGFAASFLATAAVSVGASGGIFGLLGLLLVTGLRHRRLWPPGVRKHLTLEMGMLIGINVVLGVVATFIDNAAHLAGLLTGIAWGAILQLRPEAAAYLGTDTQSAGRAV
jgi:rhomboid protease GluP